MKSQGDTVICKRSNRTVYVQNIAIFYEKFTCENIVKFVTKVVSSII